MFKNYVRASNSESHLELYLGEPPEAISSEPHMEPNPSELHLESLFRIPTDHMDREAIRYLEHRENELT